jgi:tetratricopeptide (TPR) repeat protein
MSLSRSAWTGAFFSACFVTFALRHHIRDHGRKIAAGAFILIGMTLLMPGVVQRVESIVSRHDSSNVARMEGWKGGWRIWRSHPVWGTGPDTFFQAFRPVRTIAYLRAAGPDVTQGHAHSDVIQIAATEGSLGLVLYGWILVVLGRRLWRVGFLRNDEALGFAAALLALWIQDQFNFSAVSTSAWAAVFAGIVFASNEAPVTALRFPDSWSIRRLGRAGLMVFALVGLWAILIPIRADWHFKQGKAWAQGGQYPTALREFREAVRLNGRVEVYVSEQADAARSSGNWDEAWSAAQSLARQHPSNPDAWNNLGVAAMWMTQLAGQDRWQDALSAFQKAIQLDPFFVDAWANLAKYRHLKGDLIEEKTLWQHVLELDPHHEMARKVLGLP